MFENLRFSYTTFPLKKEQTGCVRGSIPRGGVTSLRAHKAELSGGVIATENRAKPVKNFKSSGKVTRRKPPGCLAPVGA